MNADTRCGFNAPFSCHNLSTVHGSAMAVCCALHISLKCCSTPPCNSIMSFFAQYEAFLLFRQSGLLKVQFESFCQRVKAERCTKVADDPSTSTQCPSGEPTAAAARASRDGLRHSAHHPQLLSLGTHEQEQVRPESPKADPCSSALPDCSPPASLFCVHRLRQSLRTCAVPVFLSFAQLLPLCPAQGGAHAPPR